HDDRLSVERPEAQDLGAHDSRPRLRGEIVREALADRVGPASLRHEIGIAREDVRRHAGKRCEDRPREAKQKRADEEACERTRSDKEGTAPFVRTRTAARRDGTRPAEPAAAKEIRSAKTTATPGGDKITRFGRPARGANETTACATTTPSADPRIAPESARTSACAS